MAKRKFIPRVVKREKSSKITSKKFLKLAANLLIIIGILMFIYAAHLIWQRNNPDRLSFKNYSINDKNISSGNIPVSINIRDLGINLPVIPAKVIKNIWETTDDGASYLNSSPIPGEIGKSIIYAHDWASLFRPLLNARIGQVINIEYKDKSVKNFVIKNIEIVDYTNTSVLKSGKERSLTLYTCTGFLDSQRFVVNAVLMKDN